MKNKSIKILFVFFTLFSCSKGNGEENNVPTGKEAITVSTNKTTFNYSDKLNVNDFSFTKEDGTSISSSSIEIEGFDAYNNRKQNVKFIDKESKDYGYFELKLKPIDSFKVLLISNSHGEDVMHYSFELATSAGCKDFRFVNMFMAGAQMGSHVTNIKTDFDGYQFQDYKGGDPEITTAVTIKEAVEADNWDFIILQQISSNSRKPSFINDMNTLMDYCFEHCSNKNVKFLYNMPFAYANLAPETIVETFWDGSPLKMYQNIAEVTRDYVSKVERIETVIPMGTAAQNAASVIGDNEIHRDALHMNDFGRFVIGHAFVSKITGHDVAEMTFTGSYETKMKDLALKASELALLNPYEVSDMEK